MISTILIAALLVAMTVAVHAFGFAVLVRTHARRHDASPTQPWPVTLMLVRLAWWLILFHTVEITVWAMCYWWVGCLPTVESAFYFSGVTYTTIGYGDVVLPDAWRLLGPIEGLTGILMCGLSAGLFFAMLNRIYAARSEIRAG